MIQSPGNSPNTDGIHIQASQNVAITNSKISSGNLHLSIFFLFFLCYTLILSCFWLDLALWFTGDDCISIGDYSSNVQIYNIQCGPGHGIRLSLLYPVSAIHWPD